MSIKNSTKYGIFIVGAFSLLILSAFAISNSSQDCIKIPNNPSQKSIDEPITISRSALLAAYTYEDLNNNSDTVIIGTVKEILPSKWNTADGKQPDKTAAELESSDIIYTDIIVNVDKYLKNPLSSNEVTVRVIGGTVGSVSMTSDDEPNFKLGEKVLLYLKEDTYRDTKNVGSEHFVTTGHLQGKFTLTGDGKAATPYESITQEELLSTIKE